MPSTFGLVWWFGIPSLGAVSLGRQGNFCKCKLLHPHVVSIIFITIPLIHGTGLRHDERILAHPCYDIFCQNCCYFFWQIEKRSMIYLPTAQQWSSQCLVQSSIKGKWLNVDTVICRRRNYSSRMLRAGLETALGSAG
jgi:hypothetical protein